MFNFQKKYINKVTGETVISKPKSSILRKLFHVTHHQAFYITIYIIIVLDMVNLAFAIVAEYHPDWHNKKNIFRSLNVLFVGLYIIEAVIKVS